MKYIELIKSRGQAVVITGDEGVGKSLLAKEIAGGDFAYVEMLQDLLGLYTNWAYDQPKVVIVDCSWSDLDLNLDEVRHLFQSEKVVVNIKFKNLHQITTPAFIFVMHSNSRVKAKFNKEFQVIDLGGAP